MRNSPEIIVAGHLCLDIIPDLSVHPLQDMLVPGRLVQAGRAVIATGGAVSNTGLALYRLGVPVRLIGRIGDDWMGQAILGIYQSFSDHLAEDIKVVAGEQSSYSIVLSPAGTDRIFLHCPGANDTFHADDLDLSRLQSAKWFHFGYPPSMKGMYAEDGRELERVFLYAKEAGLTTTLDMSMPSPNSEASRADWRSILEHVLPKVDFFMPSLEELLFMLGIDPNVRIDAKLLRECADEILSYGAAVALIKLGDQGLYMRTTSDSARLASSGPGFAHADDANWIGRELLAPCFRVDVAGTTGAGDSTIAGFLAGMVRRRSPEEALIGAVGTGACCVESVDAVSGIPDYAELQRRIQSGWSSREVTIALDGWRRDDRLGIWLSPQDTHYR